MNVISAPALEGLGFDTVATCTDAQLDALWALGYRAAAVYLPLPGGRLTHAPEYVARLLERGWQVWPVQHVRYHVGNLVGQLSGAVDALSACTAAKAMGFPKGVHVYQDLEDVTGSTEEAIKFATDFASTCVLSGYLAGLYHGFAVPLNASQLYNLRFVTSYWTDAGNRPVFRRGNAITQKATITVAGVQIDPDVISRDSLGELPVFAVSAPDEVA